MGPLPRVINSYRLDSRLGAGGMGEVFRAVNLASRQPVAVKLMRPEYTSPDAVERFMREVRHTASLVHPNVIKVLDVGRTMEGELYFVMELLEGEPLSALLRRDGRVGVERTVRIGVQVCAALAVAHQAGIVHRDIKPPNLVLVPQEGRAELVKVLDFGVARSLEEDTQITGTGMVVGTTEYLAPEQLLGQPYDGRVDMYALGVTLFRMLSGTQVFPKATDSASLMYHQINVRPDPLSQRAPDAEIPPALEWVVMRCLQKDPGERFANMTELAAALLSASEGADAVAEGELENAAYRRCGRCEIDNSRFATECSRCGSDLNSAAQRAYMLRHLTSVRMSERAARVERATAESPVMPAAARPPSRPPGAPPVSAPRPVPVEPAPPPTPSTVAPESPGEFFFRLMRFLSVEVWKRVLAYTALTLLLGALFCRLNWIFIGGTLAVIAVSAVGLWAHARE